MFSSPNFSKHDPALMDLIVYSLRPKNISKNWSINVNVFGLKFISNTLTYDDSFFLHFGIERVYLLLEHLLWELIYLLASDV
jgi:hypothetical protein